jgi:hypothetical protein
VRYIKSSARNYMQVGCVTALVAIGSFFAPLTMNVCKPVPTTAVRTCRRCSVALRVSPAVYPLFLFHILPSALLFLHGALQELSTAADLVKLYCKDGEFNELASLFLVPSEV